MPELAPEARDDAADGLRSSILILLLLTATQKIAGFVRSLLVYRWLEPVETGTWGMAQAMLDLALPLVLLSIPGCFGRYLERFRRQGNARRFLAQAAAVCGGMIVLGGWLVWLNQSALATAVFGDPRQTQLVLAVALALVPSAIFAFVNELLVGLRRSQGSSLGHFQRSLLFALLTIVLAGFWRRDVFALVLACGLSYAFALITACGRVLRAIRDLPQDQAPLPFGLTWAALTPVILMIWLSDFLSNMFITIDRYMLLRMLPGDRQSALGLIGNYEAAQVIPILVATTIFMVARLLLPYQARLWEHGKREEVAHGVAGTLRFAGLTLVPVCLLVAGVAGWVFDTWFQGRYDAGREIVSRMAGIYLWSGLSALLMNFLWCAERGIWGLAATSTGLLTNVMLNAAWVPTSGIEGAAAATLIANGVQFALLAVISRRHGMQWPLGLIAVGLLPAAFMLPDTAIWGLWGCVLLLNCLDPVLRDSIGRGGVSLLLLARSWSATSPHRA